MKLRSGGIDFFYIDESNDNKLYAVTAVTVPMLRLQEGVWQITWHSHLEGARAWRKRLSDQHKIPAKKELHGTKLIGGRGNYLYGSRQIPPDDAPKVYQSILADIDYLPDGSIISVVGGKGQSLYGHDKLERVMLALFQRMQSQCKSRNTNAMVFFDEGHKEYREMLRKSMVFMPVGSSMGTQARNIPLDMCIEDGNEKTPDTATLRNWPT